MTPFEFSQMKGIGPLRRRVSGAELQKQVGEKTILLGVTKEGYVWHVYLFRNKFNIYSYRQSIENFEVISRTLKDELDLDDEITFMPDKYLIPEACDFGFCKLLKEAGIYLPRFSAYGDYHGRRNGSYCAEIY